MSRPFKEVIFYNKVGVSLASDGTTGRLGLIDRNGVKFGTDAVGIYKLWGGSINQFISDFELPSDFRKYWRTNSSDTVANAIEIADGYHNTINFKVNLQFWYRLNTNDHLTNFAPCSNVTFDITLPNFLSYNAAVVGYPNQSDFRAYNPNLFPIIFSNSKFAGSNKAQNSSTYDGTTWGGLGSAVPFLVFRYNVDNQDIQICILNLNGGNPWDQNSSPVYLARASLTFLGFNTTKKVNRT